MVGLGSTCKVPEKGVGFCGIASLLLSLLLTPVLSEVLGSAYPPDMGLLELFDMIKGVKVRLGAVKGAGWRYVGERLSCMEKKGGCGSYNGLNWLATHRGLRVGGV